MRIAVASSGACWVNRGVEVWAQGLAEALSGKGHDAVLFCGNRSHHDPNHTGLWNVRRDSAFGRALGSPETGLRSFVEQASFSLSLLLRLEGFDVVHTGDPTVAYNVQRWKRMGRYRGSVVFMNGVSADPTWCSRIEHVQELAPYYVERAQRAGIDVSGWFCIPNFVNVEEFFPRSQVLARKCLGVPADAFVILSVGVLDKTHKRMDKVIREVATLKSRESGSRIFLILVGRRTLETSQLEIEARATLGNDFLLLADVPRRDVPYVYAAADVFVLASVNRSPISFLEAMATGVPVIGNDHPVHRWLISHGGSAVNMDAPGELSVALSGYLDAQHRRRVGEAARGLAVRRFSVDVVIKQIEEMYSQVVSNEK